MTILHQWERREFLEDPNDVKTQNHEVFQNFGEWCLFFPFRGEIQLGSSSQFDLNIIPYLHAKFHAFIPKWTILWQIYWTTHPFVYSLYRKIISVYRLKNLGDNIQPCRTPRLMEKNDDMPLSILTAACCCQYRYPINRLSLLSISLISIHFIISLWYTRSNAFL